VQEIIDGLPEKEEATEQPTAAQPETEANLIQALQKYTEAIMEGGEGSGNFGHEGRPGEVGGSGGGGGSFYCR
jgi:hypothetical protein